MTLDYLHSCPLPRLLGCALGIGIFLISVIGRAQECPGILGLNRVNVAGGGLGGGVNSDTLVLVDGFVGLSVWSLDETGMARQGEWMRLDKAPWFDDAVVWVRNDGFALVKTGYMYRDVWAFDVRDPQDPEPIWQLSFLPEQPGVMIGADYRDSVLALGGLPIVLYDLSDINRPQPTVTSIMGAVALCSGNLVTFAVFGSDGAAVYRLVPGGQPVLVESGGSFQTPSTAFVVSGDDLVVMGPSALVYDDNFPVVGVVDLSNPDRPAFHDLSTVLTWAGIRDLVFDGRMAFASVRLSGGYFIQKVDFSDPTRPQILKMVRDFGRLILTDDRLLVTGRYAVGSWDRDLETHESLEVFGGVGKILFDGDLGIVADGRGITVFDASDPENFVRLGQVSLGEGIWVDDLAIRDGYAFLAATDGGLVVIDYSQPTAPRPVAQYPLEGARDIALDGDLVLVAVHTWDYHSFDSLEVFDISDPENPEHLSSIPGFQGKYTSCVVAADGVAYLGSGGRILAVDLSDPRHPRELAASDLGAGDGDVSDLALSGNSLYATSPEYRGIDVYDISGPSGLEWVTQVGSEYSWIVAAEGDMVYFSTNSGVQLADLTNVHQPIIRSLKALRQPWAITPREGLLYLSAPPNIEVMSLDCSPPEARFEVDISGGFVQFINSSTSWWEEILWDFGDGESVEDVRDPVHFYQNSGDFEVVLSLSGEVGDSSFRRTITISGTPKSISLHEPEVDR